MYRMSRASEIAPNVWLGPTPDSTLLGATGVRDAGVPDFDVLVEASDLARPPDDRTLRRVARRSARRGGGAEPQRLAFPASGSMLPPAWSEAEADALLAMCHWMHRLANAGPTPDASEDDDDGDSAHEDEHGDSHDDLGNAPHAAADADGDIPMQPLPAAAAAPSPRPRTLLIHCSDGYTESSLLALAYFMFAEHAPVAPAWVRLHRERGRNFFAYASDVALLRALQPRLLAESPKATSPGVPAPLPTPPSSASSSASSAAATMPAGAPPSARDAKDPAWLARMDGSLPSRILDYLYLGNLGHANNPGLLKELGITRVLSVGEPVGWPRERAAGWGRAHLLLVDRVQDNGVDPLTGEFERCLAFIGTSPPFCRYPFL